jgi:hypothetical protein
VRIQDRARTRGARRVDVDAHKLLLQTMTKVVPSGDCRFSRGVGPAEMSNGPTTSARTGDTSCPTMSSCVVGRSPPMRRGTFPPGGARPQERHESSASP